MTKIVEFESADVAQKCMASWSDAHKEAAAEKQMPILKALGQVMGVQYQSWGDSRNKWVCRSKDRDRICTGYTTE